MPSARSTTAVRASASRTMIDDTLAEVRAKAFDPALPPAAGALITELAARIEDRIP